MFADVLPHLQLKRSVSEGAAPLHAFPAADAQRFINRVFKKRILYEFPPDGIGRAKLVFGSGSQGLGLRLEIAAAQVAVATHCIYMGAPDGRLGQDAICGAAPALDALGRVELPYGLPREGLSCCKHSHAPDPDQEGGPDAGDDEFPPVDFRVIC